MQPSFSEYWDDRHQLWVAACEQLDIFQADPYAYEPTVAGLEVYLTASGIKYFTAREATRPWQTWHEPLLPPQASWIAGTVLLTIADRFRAEARLPIRCRNWYRPPDYNSQAAKGASRSDHLWACAVDLDFLGGNRNWLRRVRARRAAQRMVQGLLPRDLLSLGIGWTTLHVGYAAPRTLEIERQRRWKYGKLPSSEKYI